MNNVFTSKHHVAMSHSVSACLCDGGGDQTDLFWCHCRSAQVWITQADKCRDLAQIPPDNIIIIIKDKMIFRATSPSYSMILVLTNHTSLKL